MHLLINCLYLYISRSLKMYNSELIPCIQGISQILWNTYSWNIITYQFQLIKYFIFYFLLNLKDLWISVCTRITLLSSFCMTVVTIYLQKLTVIRCTSRIQRTYNREQFLSIFRKINKYLNFSFPLRISNQLVIDDSSLHFFLIIHNIPLKYNYTRNNNFLRYTSSPIAIHDLIESNMNLFVL